MAEADTVPITVVIPTAGRERLLQRCLESLASCDPRAAEIVVVDQSARAAVADVVDSFAAVGARLVLCQGTGVARGRWKQDDFSPVCCICHRARTAGGGFGVIPVAWSGRFLAVNHSRT